ncbi:MAG TPA: SLBB domain-containing protein, partial [Bryobacteraceae bacterium]|nr:SLBB domain-containing protein [Bryobacteraceae bacterium]
SSDIARNSSEINWDYAAIERLDQQDLSTRLIAFNLGKAIDEPASPQNKTLRPGDVVTIFSLRDMPLPMDKHAMFVRVDGEVNAPGLYRVHPGETLRQVVKRAGGLTPHSYLFASQLTRVSTRRAEEQELQESTMRMRRELASRYAAAPALTSSNAPDQSSQYKAQQALLEQLATIHPTGRIVLDMMPDASSVNDIPAFPLEDGDNYYIPPRLATVQVAGAVYNPNAFRYEPKKRLSAYLDDAGGPTREADKRRIFLIRADGTVVSSQSHGRFWRTSFGDTILLPGDAIVVPTRMKTPGGFLQQLPFVTQILSQTALTGAVIGSAY